MLLVNAPEGFDQIVGASSIVEGNADVIVWFVVWREDLEGQLDSMIQRLNERGGLWIAWPKRASKAPTDLTEDTLREVILRTGLVDNKVCAIDEKWSGLRFVRRRKQA